jgi:hypothetical protein
MKTTFFLMTIPLSAILLPFACIEEEAMPSLLSDADQTVHFVASAPDPLHTRATDNNPWQVDDCIGVYMIQTGKILQTTTIVDGKKNIPYRVYEVKAGGEALFEPLHPASGISFPAHDAVNFVAYYPYEASVGDDFLLKAGKQDQSESPAPPLLYSNEKIPYTKASGRVALRFDHRMSKVTLDISRADSNAPPLHKLHVKLKNLKTEATLHLPTGFLPDGMGNGLVNAHILHASVNRAGAEVLLLPVEDTNRIEISLLVNDSVQYHIPLIRNDKAAFLAGHHHALEVTLYGR